MRILLNSLLIGTLLVGCNKVYHDTFIVVNNTNHNIIIEGYAVKWSKKINRNSVYYENIELQANQKFSIIKGKGEANEPKGIFESPHLIDSVNVIFDNIKIIKYSCNSLDGVDLCNDKRNILNYQEYYEKKCGEHECTYTYTITESDFEFAEIIK